MQTFRDDSTDRFNFKNHKRIDERDLFEEAKGILEKSATIKFGHRKEVLYVDVWQGTHNGTEFELVLDINYGSYLICKDKIVLAELEKIVNEA